MLRRPRVGGELGVAALGPVGGATRCPVQQQHHRQRRPRLPEPGRRDVDLGRAGHETRARARDVQRHHLPGGPGRTIGLGTGQRALVRGRPTQRLADGGEVGEVRVHPDRGTDTQEPDADQRGDALTTGPADATVAAAASPSSPSTPRAVPNGHQLSSGMSANQRRSLHYRNRVRVGGSARAGRGCAVRGGDGGPAAVGGHRPGRRRPRARADPGAGAPPAVVAGGARGRRRVIWRRRPRSAWARCCWCSRCWSARCCSRCRSAARWTGRRPTPVGLGVGRAADRGAGRVRAGREPDRGVDRAPVRDWLPAGVVLVGLLAGSLAGGRPQPRGVPRGAARRRRRALLRGGRGADQGRRSGSSTRGRWPC